jgi:hypothetical protein
MEYCNDAESEGPVVNCEKPYVCNQNYRQCLGIETYYIYLWLLFNKQ